MDEDNKTGKYPPDLGTLLVRKHAQMPWFVCPAAPSALPDGWQKMTPKQQGDWVNAHSDYVYVGAGKNNSAGSDVPIAYERDDDHGDGFINVLFADSFVKTMRLADARRILGPKAGTERNTTRLKPAPGQPPVWPMITENEAKAIVARTDLAGINQALDMFQIDSKRLPSTAEGLEALVEKPRLMLTPWDGPYIKGGIPEDPWGHPYRYVRRGGGRDEYDLFSCGPDGLPGTADDISYPK